MAKQTKKSILLSIGGEENKHRLFDSIRDLSRLGCVLYATEHTAEFLEDADIRCRLVHKISSDARPNIATLLRERRFDLIINIPSAERNFQASTDGEQIRELAVKHSVPLVTSVDVARHMIEQMGATVRE